MFNELSWPTVPDNATHERGVIIYKSRAVLALGRAFTAVPSDRLLAALAPRVKYNPGALEHWRGLPKGPAVLPPNGPEFTAPDDAPLKTHEVGAAVACWVVCATLTHFSLPRPNTLLPLPITPNHQQKGLRHRAGAAAVGARL